MCNQGVTEEPFTLSGNFRARVAEIQETVRHVLRKAEGAQRPGSDREFGFRSGIDERFEKNAS